MSTDLSKGGIMQSTWLVIGPVKGQTETHVMDLSILEYCPGKVILAVD